MCTNISKRIQVAADASRCGLSSKKMPSLKKFQSDLDRPPILFVRNSEHFQTSKNCKELKKEQFSLFGSNDGRIKNLKDYAKSRTKLEPTILTTTQRKVGLTSIWFTSVILKRKSCVWGTHTHTGRRRLDQQRAARRGRRPSVTKL